MSETAKSETADQLTQKIINDIEKSGFPLELHVLNACSTKNCGRMPSLRYEFRNELREIDLVAFFESIEQERKAGHAPYHLATTLIIECKKSLSKPWVFFSAPGYKFANVACFLKYSSDFDIYLSSEGFIPLLAQLHNRLSASHYTDPKIPRSVGYYEAFRDTDRPSDIYKALESTLNYLRYIKQLRDSRRERFGVFSDFFLPVVVLDGLLFEAYLDGSEIKVQPRSHLQVRTMSESEVFIVDIVTKDHFAAFFDEVEQFHAELSSIISSLEFPADFVTTATKKMHDRTLSPEMAGTIAMTAHKLSGKRSSRSKIRLLRTEAIQRRSR